MPKHTFEVKGYNNVGACVSTIPHWCETLNAFNGHWVIVQRIMNTMSKAKGIHSVKVFHNDVEYAYDSIEFEFVQVA